MQHPAVNLYKQLSVISLHWRQSATKNDSRLLARLKNSSHSLQETKIDTDCKSSFLPPPTDSWENGHCSLLRLLSDVIIHTKWHLKPEYFYDYNSSQTKHTLITRRTTNGGRGSESSQPQSDFCRRNPDSKSTGLGHLVHGLRAGGTLRARREQRLEVPCVISVMLGQAHGSGLQQKSLRKSRASSQLGELQGTVWDGRHWLTALQADNHVGN